MEHLFGGDMKHTRVERPHRCAVYARGGVVLLCLFLLRLSPLSAAEPDWSQIEKHALEFLQQYIRIRSINPPADTREAAALIKTELERNGLSPTLFESGR